MIARVWHGATTPENADTYEAMLKPEPLPGLERVPGYLGSLVFRRPAGDVVEFVTILFWESLDAIRAVAGDDYEHAVVPDERKKVLLRWDDRAVHYEVAASHQAAFGAAKIR